MIYSPSDDSFLLAKEVQKYLKNLSKIKKEDIKILDMGSGSGIQALTAINAGAKINNILCADINKEAILELKKQKLQTIESDLFSNIRDKFNLILFNAPYLPEDPHDKGIDTTAGKKGYEIILRFLQEAKTHLDKKGVILLLFSNLSKPRVILSKAKKLKFKAEKLAEENLGMMEKLFIYKFSL